MADAETVTILWEATQVDARKSLLDTAEATYAIGLNSWERCMGCRNLPRQAHLTQDSVSSITLYWQSLLLCHLAKEKYVQCPAPFLQSRQ